MWICDYCVDMLDFWWDLMGDVVEMIGNCEGLLVEFCCMVKWLLCILYVVFFLCEDIGYCFDCGGYFCVNNDVVI